MPFLEDFPDFLEKRPHLEPHPTLDGWFVFKKSPSSMTSQSSGSHNSHARLAPSASDRWLTCTASVAYIQENGFKNVGSVYSDEGTRAHDFASDVLKGKMKLEEVPEDFRPHIKFYIDHCLSLVPEGVRPAIEVSVPLFYDLDSVGTMDFGVFTNDLIVIRDFKYGQGVLVDAKNNTQLAIYALSAINDKIDDGLIDPGPDTRVDIGIVQPRHHEDDPIRTWQISLKDLRDFCLDISDTADMIRRGVGTKFVPSDKGCKFCPAKGECRFRAEYLTDAFSRNDVSGVDVTSAFENLDKASKKLSVEERIQAVCEKLEAHGRQMLPLSDEELVALYIATKPLMGFLDDVAELLSRRAINDGEDLTHLGLKVVTGRKGDRQWVDPDAVSQLISKYIPADQRFTKTLISPSKVDELLPDEKERSTKFNNKLQALTHRAPGKPALAIDEDRRPAIKPPAGRFDDLDEAFDPDEL